MSYKDDIMLSYFFKKGEIVTKKSVFVRSGWIYWIPWMETVVSGRLYVFQQDGARIIWFKIGRLSDNVNMFSKEFWPSNSPNLNPLDYYVWSVIERVTSLGIPIWHH